MDSSELRPPSAALLPDGSRPRRVLVAEDDPEMRRLVVEALRKDGYQVDSVSDGGRMLIALAHGIVDPTGGSLPDLIVSDVRMPVCSGLQLLEQIRTAHLRMPVVLMTAFGDDATRKQAHSLGARLLDKPFDLGELRRVVASLL